MSVELNSVTLFNLSDQVSRNNVEYGILLGRVAVTDPLLFQVHTSFEIIINNANVVDLDFLNQRLKQFQVVLPQLCVVGVYQVNSKEPSSQTVSTLGQILQHLHITTPLLILNYDSIKSFKVFSYFDEVVSSLPLKILSFDEVEKISTFTISSEHVTGKKADGHQDEDVVIGGEIDTHYAKLSTSIDQLTIKVEQILHYLNDNADKPRLTADEIRVQSLITHLANKVDLISSSKEIVVSDIDTEFLIISSKLSLLNSQVTSLKNLNNLLAFGSLRIDRASKDYSQPLPQLRGFELELPNFEFN